MAFKPDKRKRERPPRAGHGPLKYSYCLCKPPARYQHDSYAMCWRASASWHACGRHRGAHADAVHHLIKPRQRLSMGEQRWLPGAARQASGADLKQGLGAECIAGLNDGLPEHFLRFAKAIMGGHDQDVLPARHRGFLLVTLRFFVRQRAASGAR